MSKKHTIKETVGIIGYGVMGSLLGKVWSTFYKVYIYDKEKDKLSVAGSETVVNGVAELVNKAHTVVVAVKPQDYGELLSQMKGVLQEQLLISIAAGVQTGFLEQKMSGARVVRVMPNIGARVSEAVSCISKGHKATSEDVDFAHELFQHIGVTREIPEDLMDAATAISGSGPAYIFAFLLDNGVNPRDIPEHTQHDLIRRLERAAEGVGFNKEDATVLAAQTGNGCFHLLKQTNVSLEDFIKQVASKGGTTEAALGVLRSGGTWDEAAQAAVARSQELRKVK